MSTLAQFSMTIGGKSVASPTQFDVLDPATAQAVATAPMCTVDQLDEAMQSASAALPVWSADLDTRRAVLEEVATVLENAAEHLAAVLTAEQGKPLKQAKYEFTSSADWFRYYAKLAQETELLNDDATARVDGVRKPLGVVAAITPWNFPILLANWKLAPRWPRATRSFSSRLRSLPLPRWHSGNSYEASCRPAC